MSMRKHIFIRRYGRAYSIAKSVTDRFRERGERSIILVLIGYLTATLDFRVVNNHFVFELKDIHVM